MNYQTHTELDQILIKILSEFNLDYLSNTNLYHTNHVY